MKSNSMMCALALLLVGTVACEEKPEPTPTPATNTAPPKPATNNAPAETNNAPATQGAVAPSTAAQGALPDPKTLTETAPDKFSVTFATTEGDFTVDLTRDWAPNGVDRFYNLVKVGYYTDIAAFRVIDGFMAQFGIHGDPSVNTRFSEATIKDDPGKKGISNTPGYLTYAMRGPHTRTVQLFINHGNNASLDKQGFTPIGVVAGDGMSIVKKWHKGYGEGAPNGKGPHQGKVQSQGNDYLKRDFPELSYIKSITLAGDAAAAATPKPDATPKPKKAWEAGTYTHKDISESSVENGTVRINLKDDGVLMGSFQGKREGKGFSIPLKGEINAKGEFQAAGNRGPNSAKITGRFNAGGVFGNLQGTIHAKPVRVALKAKK